MRGDVRWVVPVALLGLSACIHSGCSCDEDSELVAEGYVRCHLAPPPEGDRRHGALRLHFEERTLTIGGLPEAPRLAVGAGPIGDARVPEGVSLAILIGDLAGEPIPETEALVILLAGGADPWDAWSEGRTVHERDGIVDATPLRRIIAGSLELIPVPGAPPRYVRTVGCCGLARADADAWRLEAAGAGVHRVLLSWAAPTSQGLLGVEIETPAVAAIEREVGAEDALYAWPRLDPGAARPLGGPWVTRANGSREPPGWTVYDVGEGGLTRRPDSP